MGKKKEQRSQRTTGLPSPGFLHIKGARVPKRGSKWVKKGAKGCKKKGAMTF